MAVTKAEIRSGAYYDSVVLMQLQRSLATLLGILDAGVVMGTDANKEILAQTGLLTPEAKAAGADDLVIVVRAEDKTAAQAALGRVDELLTQRRRSVEQDYLPRSLESAAQMLPDAQWVLISVPGRFAAGVAREALHLGKHVFLYSDNVSLDDEISLKQLAAEKGLLVMGPDCGTAIVNGVGLGFANKVRRGPIGLVAASGTGLQQVSVRIHQLGGGVTNALGTGGRDLSEAVGAVTARQGLDLLSRDPETQVIVLISKPPSPQVAEGLLAAARSAGKPVVVDFIGYLGRSVDNLHFVNTFDETAELAVRLAASRDEGPPGETEGHPSRLPQDQFATGQHYLRGLFSGGTLAYEAQLLLQDYVPAVYSNAPLKKEFRLSNSLVSQEHTIVDLGEDEFTVGRLHPMMDNALRIRRLQQEAEDPEVAVLLLDYVPIVYSNAPLKKESRLANSLVSQEHTIVDLGEDEFTVGRLHPMMDNALRILRLQQEAEDPEVAVLVLDVVLGYGAHPDPAGELAPAIARARAAANQAGRYLEVVAVVVGTDDDPQGLAAQVQRLEEAGAKVETSNDAAIRYVGRLLQALNPREASRITGLKPVDLSILHQPLAALNAGLESFAQSLKAQGAPVIQVDWRPPAGGNEKLAAILARMKR